MIDISSLHKALSGIETKINAVKKDIVALSKEAITLNGDVARVLPINLKTTEDILNNILYGDDQNSIKNLRAYVSALTLGDLQDEETVPTTEVLNPDVQNVTAQPVVSDIPQPNLQNEPKSAIIANESIDLSKYKKVKEDNMKLNENGELSFDAIKNEVSVDNNPEFDEEAAMSTDLAAFNYSDIYTNDEDDYEDDTSTEPSFEDYEASLDKDEGDLPTYEDAMNFNQDNFAVTDGRYTDDFTADHASTYNFEPEFDVEAYEKHEAEKGSEDDWETAFNFNNDNI